MVTEKFYIWAILSNSFNHSVKTIQICTINWYLCSIEELTNVLTYTFTFLFIKHIIYRTLLHLLLFTKLNYLFLTFEIQKHQWNLFVIDFIFLLLPMLLFLLSTFFFPFKLTSSSSSSLSISTMFSKLPNSWK